MLIPNRLHRQPSTYYSFPEAARTVFTVSDHERPGGGGQDRNIRWLCVLSAVPVHSC